MNDKVNAQCANVSVIIAHYNDPQSLDRALKSVFLQTRIPLEVFVVDDYSSPRNVEAVREIIRDQPSVALIELTENRGPATARNTGWQAATGEYVAFLDSDDVWHPKKLEIQLQILDSDRDVALVSGAVKRVSSLDAFASSTLSSSFRMVSNMKILAHNPFGTTSTVILRNRPFPKFPEGKRHAEDYHLWISLSKEGRLVLLDDAVSGSFKHPVGESGLSGQVWGMLRAESGVFISIWRSGVISLPEMLFAQSVFLLRGCRRILRHLVRKSAKFIVREK